MIEAGHFHELENIVRLTLRVDRRNAGNLDDTPQKDHDMEMTFATLEREAGLLPTSSEIAPSESLQTFVFSATMSKELQGNLRKKRKPGIKKNADKKSTLRFSGQGRKARGYRFESERELGRGAS